ncbi:hypothetical protein [Bradyrhizobium sp. NBAIM08]|uniref:hypothetical protein n=1 Tax=Bradyrhizobium sp. NBAIM08 TaxID=2793815 RepID=UPI001CD732A9|nr:hypothetical protein [Bradyrhizobium sp. NBAIM08]MCA1479832.1 hypothetical protein [Bradyrhizobium sp. NBAIM08]
MAAGRVRKENYQVIQNGRAPVAQRWLGFRILLGDKPPPTSLSVAEAFSCLRIRNESIAFEISCSKTTYRFELIFVFLMLPISSVVWFHR